MKSIRGLLLAISFVAAVQSALAGPAEGDFFGYRLGNTYPVTDSTKGNFMGLLGQAVVVAEKPDKSDDFMRVEVITTPKSFTIANIYGVAEVANEKEAKAMSIRYADLLQSLHGSTCTPDKAYLGEALKLLCGRGQYEMTVSHYSPNKNETKFKVHVGLKFANDSESGKKLLKQFKDEQAQLEREGKKYRLEKAMKEQKLRGLQ